ncbi:MAG: hypothetical protein NT038_05055 [Euryarchaeota archaeon]|nr:hypothetical protein [Euryarchaeota archaeon]
MKRRMWVVWGSVGAVVLLVLAMFPSAVGTQIVKSNEKRINLIQSIRDRISKHEWAPGDIIMAIILFIVITIGFLKGEIFF